ncbi:MAG: hypothetical protein ABH851_00005 [Methanobacteriota archaeon]
MNAQEKIYNIQPSLSNWYYWFGEVEKWPQWPDIKDIYDALEDMKQQRISWKAMSGGRAGDQCLFSIFQAFSKKFIFIALRK